MPASSDKELNTVWQQAHPSGDQRVQICSDDEIHRPLHGRGQWKEAFQQPLSKVTAALFPEERLWMKSEYVLVISDAVDSGQIYSCWPFCNVLQLPYILIF